MGAGLETPLLIGGATTAGFTRPLKIHPNYRAARVYVNDASRASASPRHCCRPIKRGLHRQYPHRRYRIAPRSPRGEEQKRRMKLIAARANAHQLDGEATTAPTRPRCTVALRDFRLPTSCRISMVAVLLDLGADRQNRPTSTTTNMGCRRALFDDCKAMLDHHRRKLFARPWRRLGFWQPMRRVTRATLRRRGEANSDRDAATRASN